MSGRADKREHFEAAQQTANWLQSCALQTKVGKAWPADPHDSTTVSTNLYSGSSGVVLFFLEIYRSTQNKIYLNEACAGADYLIATLPEKLSEEQSGLYTGVAGIGFVLQKTFKTTGDLKYRDGARRCIKLLHENAKRVGAGVEWNNVTDIISLVDENNVDLLDGVIPNIEDIFGEVAGVYPRIMQDGDMDAGAWSCGMVVGLIHDIPTVHELIARTMAEAERIPKNGRAPAA